jgi:hypothetical protein
MNQKAIRDAVVTGAPATLVLSMLIEQGVPTATATALSVLASALASMAYRAVRARWPWLLAVDAPTGAK